MANELTIKEALLRDQMNLDEMIYPTTHPGSAMRLVASIASTWRRAKDSGDPGLVGVAEMNLYSAALLYDRYFPERHR